MPIDRNNPAIGALSSTLAAAQADIARRIQGVSASYRAAERHRLSDSRARSYQRFAGTADSHLTQPDRDELIARSRDADRNYAIARSLVDQHVDLIAGDGFTPKPNTGDKAVDKRISALWKRWCQRPEVTGRFDYDRTTEVAVRHVALDGAVLVAPTELDQVQLIGAQRLRSPGGTWDSLEWRGGIRIGQYGQPVEYNVVEWQSQGRGVKPTSGRRLRVVPNRTSPFLLACNRLEDQYVGEPMLAPILEDLGQTQDLMESVHQAAHMAALMAFVHTTMDGTGTANMLGAQDQSDYDGLGAPTTRQVAAVGDAGVYTLRQGETLTALQGAQPTQNYADMIRLNIRLLGAATCLPLELSLLSFDQSNFHGALAAIEVAARRAERRQDWLVAEMHTPLYEWQVECWAADGLLGENAASMPADALFNVDWRYPRRLVVDPKREAEVFQIMHRMGGMSLRDLRGDWEELMQQIAEEQARMRELGIRVETTPGSKPVASAAGPGAAGADAGEAGGDDENGEGSRAEEARRIRLAGN